MTLRSRGGDLGEEGLIAALLQGRDPPRHGDHGVASIRRPARSAIEAAGQVLVAAPVLGRPDMAAAGQLDIVIGRAGRGDRSLPAAVRRRWAAAPSRPEPIRSPPRPSRSPTISCSAAPSRRWARRSRWSAATASAAEAFYDVMTDGLFSAPAYKVYGRIISTRAYDQLGVTAVLGLKDCQSGARGRRGRRRAAADRQCLARPSDRRGRPW